MSHSADQAASPSAASAARSSIPPHDPESRVLVGHIGDWEVRMIPPRSELSHYLARKEMWHIQLWHPQARFSLLTASVLTARQFEVYPVAAGKFRSDCYATLRIQVAAACLLELPSPLDLANLYHDIRLDVLGRIEGAKPPACVFFAVHAEVA